MNSYYKPQVKIIASTIEDVVERCEDLTTQVNKFLEKNVKESGYSNTIDIAHSEKSSSLIINYFLYIEEESK